MNKSKYNLTGLANSLSQGKSLRKSGLTALSSTSESSPEIKTAATKLSAGSDSSLRLQSSNAKQPTGIQFGKPSSSRTSTSASSDLSSLLKTTESSGLSNLLGGGGLLGGLTGLGSLGSLISGLFGGKSTKTLPPLTTFSLPQATSETYSVRSGASTSTGMTGSSVNSGIYAAAVSRISPAVSSPAASSDRIAQAVKTAILSSNSLNDVINEI